MSALRLASLLFLTVLAFTSRAQTPGQDPHYNAVGFFDIHVCHWPDQPLFLMALFSTTDFPDIARIDLIAPDNTELGPFESSRYRVAGDVQGKEKRVFITHYPVPAKNADGWYRARVTLKNGQTHEARDHVISKAMPLATGHQPPDQAEKIALPTELRWAAIPGASHYQVYLRDEWESDRMLLTSPIVTENRLTLPAGLLQPGGSYAWRVHARDLNGDPEWGDFNHGSFAKEVTFSVAE